MRRTSTTNEGVGGTAKDEDTDHELDLPYPINFSPIQGIATAKDDSTNDDSSSNWCSPDTIKKREPLRPGDVIFIANKGPGIFNKNWNKSRLQHLEYSSTRTNQARRQTKKTRSISSRLMVPPHRPTTGQLPMLKTQFFYTQQ